MRESIRSIGGEVYIYLILRSRRNPHAPTTTRKICDVWGYAEAKQALQEYMRTMRNNTLVQATLMESATKPIRTIYREGLWYY